jgi:hypothetical protein
MLVLNEDFYIAVNDGEELSDVIRDNMQEIIDDNIDMIEVTHEEVMITPELPNQVVYNFDGYVADLVEKCGGQEATDE